MNADYLRARSRHVSLIPVKEIDSHLSFSSSERDAPPDGDMGALINRASLLARVVCTTWRARRSRVGLIRNPGFRLHCDPVARWWRSRLTIGAGRSGLRFVGYARLRFVGSDWARLLGEPLGHLFPLLSGKSRLWLFRYTRHDSLLRGWGHTFWRIG